MWRSEEEVSITIESYENEDQISVVKTFSFFSQEIFLLLVFFVFRIRFQIFHLWGFPTFKQNFVTRAGGTLEYNGFRENREIQHSNKLVFAQNWKLPAGTGIFFVPGDLPSPLSNHPCVREPSGNDGAGEVLPLRRFRGFREIRSPKKLDIFPLVSRGAKILFFCVAPAILVGVKHQTPAPCAISRPGLAGFRR